jgi:predicted TIM-barrel fold metal-dependent hydrolase
MGGNEDPYLVVSCDGHVNPALEDYRPYCPKNLTEEYKEFEESQPSAEEFFFNSMFVGFTDGGIPENVRNDYLERGFTPGYRDPVARLEDQNMQGISAEVLFFGGGAFGPLPFGTSKSLEQRTAGVRTYNRWLADFASTSPDRFIGVALLPIWDLEATVEEVRWAREAGLKSLNFPAPRHDLPADYNDPLWEPFWAACQEYDMPLNSHVGGGPKISASGRGATAIFFAQVHRLAGNGLTYLIFGGVFDRYPGLKVVYTEQRSRWIPETLRNHDSLYWSHNTGMSGSIKKLPSEYWATNCFVGNSFMSRAEVEMRHELGLDTIMWGADYPHLEGTFPWTRESLQNTFSGIPHDDVRKILGTNAVRCFGLNEESLRAVAANVGPTIADIDRGLEHVPDDSIGVPTLGFRTVGDFF